MKFFSRPWSIHAREKTYFSGSDCLLSESSSEDDDHYDSALIMGGILEDEWHQIKLYPYPVKGNGKNPDRKDFPLRPQKKSKDDVELFENRILKSMHEVLERIGDLGEALEDPIKMWDRLDEAWTKAQNESEPRMSAIVKQSKDLNELIRGFDKKLRKILRRNNELTPIGRAEEMDRVSIRWLVRQPGKSVIERAGATQRVMATVRRENYDTPENRVLRSYTLLVSEVAKEWTREHDQARQSERYKLVKKFKENCSELAAFLDKLGVKTAPTDMQPNYALMQNIDYRKIYEAWRTLLLKQKEMDDLWAWQAESWTDFCSLALVLTINKLEEIQLVAQSPIAWSVGADFGRFFIQDDPLAVFWLRDRELLVEIISRAKHADIYQLKTRAQLFVRVSRPSHDERTTLIPVWTPHALTQFDLKSEVNAAAEFLEHQNLGNSYEVVRNGLIMLPAYYHNYSFLEQEIIARVGRTQVYCIPFDPNGIALKNSMASLSKVVISTFLRGHW